MEQFKDIFSKIEEGQQEVIVTKPVPRVKEFWKEIMPGLYQCRITGRKLSKVGFRIYQDQSVCGPIGFVVEVV